MEFPMAIDKQKHVELSQSQASGADASGSTLLPMLIAGLVLIIIGAVAVMTFV